MQQEPLVSIIVPCFNQAIFLPEAVESVIVQSYPNWELLIVNDGSPDNTNQVFENLTKLYPQSKRKLFLIQKENGGLSDARNTGISQARGDYILPLDADDKIHPEMLSNVLHDIRRSGSDIVFTNYKEFGLSSRSTNYGDVEPQLIQYFNQLPYCSLFKRNIWITTGGYNTNMIYGYEDWDFWISCIERGYKALRCSNNQALFFYRIKNSSMYTKALEHDTELRAQIVLNHSALYDPAMVQEAKLIITNKPHQQHQSEKSLQEIIEVVSEVERMLAKGDTNSSAINRYRQWLWFHANTSPMSYLVYFNLGVLLQENDVAAASNAYKRALEQKPDFLPALKKLGHLQQAHLAQN